MITSTKVIQVVETVELLDIPNSNDKRQLVQYRLVPNGELLAQNDSLYNPAQMEQAILQLQKENQDMKVRLTPIAPPPTPLSPAEELTQALSKIEEAKTGILNLERATQDARRQQSDNCERADRAIKAISSTLYSGAQLTDNVIQG